MDYAGLDDPVIDIAITPNRADCLGVRGVARDLAAAGLGTLKPLDTGPVPAISTTRSNGVWNSPKGASISALGRRPLFPGVKNGPSPKWMQDRLSPSACGRSRRWSISPTM